MAELSTTDSENKPEKNQNQLHNEYVRDLAMVLFDQTQPLHELTESCRLVLAQAALFHHLTPPPGKKSKKPERKIRKGLREELAGEFPDEKIDLLTAVIGTYQRVIKRKDYDRLGLSPTQQREALTLASLLSIATGFDDSRSQTTTLLQIEPEREQLWIVVDGPHAASDAARSQHNARLWGKIGYPEAKILVSSDAAEKLLPYPTPMETIGITKWDNLAEAGRKAMRFQFAYLIANEGGTRLGEDIEALHDMRVATRRLRAAFQVFQEGFENGILNPYSKGLRATGRALGAVRDMDVFILKALAYLETLPEDQRRAFDPMLGDWDNQREKRRKKMLAYLDSQEYHTFKRKFNIFLSTPGAGARQFPEVEPVPQRVRELAPVLVYTRLAVVRAYDPFIPDATVERLHALRIEFRKLRYTVEFFREILAEPVEEVIREFKSFQDHLGDLNDANVAVQTLETFIAAHEDDDIDLEPVREVLAVRSAERKKLLESTPVVWDNLNRPELQRGLATALAVL